MAGMDIGIDLGTANVLIAVDDKGVVLSEPSVVAVDKRIDEVIAVGHEAYNMIGYDEVTGKPFMDEDGNSNVELALDWIKRKEEQIRNSSKSIELKQLQLSQKCTSPAQAFDTRSVSEFPLEQIKRQQERILLKDKENKWEFKPLKGLLEEDISGKIILNTKNLPPEHGYPIKPEWVDKRGVWTFYGPLPDRIPSQYEFFACVDAVEVDVTETSESVASIDIFMAPIFVDYTDEKGKKQTKVEGDKLYATYRGRFDIPDKTNEQMWYGIKLFNALVYPERNKPNFINYMRRMGRAERYLAKEGDVPVFKDLNVKNGNFANNSKFGFHKGDNTEIWKHFKATAKEYFFTEYGRSTFEKNGEEVVLKLFTGIDRIDDYWLLEEFKRYHEVKGKIKGNYDRLVSFMGALFISKIYQQNRIVKRRNEEVKEKKEEVRVVKRPISMLGGYGYRKPQSLL